MTAPIYVDFNATAPIFPEVADAVREASQRYAGNPSSQHAAGRSARAALEDARERLGELLGARLGGRDGDRLVFTSGATEANNLALLGWADSQTCPAHACHFLLTPLEHPSVSKVGDRLRRRGWNVDLLALSKNGVVQESHFDELLGEKTRLVSVVLASSETGVMQPIADLSVRMRAFPAVFHSDAVQAVGKIAVDFRRLGVDSLACAAHKFHGPLGIGALVTRSTLDLAPQMVGGVQQQGFRPGTETTALAIGMCRALEICTAVLEDAGKTFEALRDRFEHALSAMCPDLAILGKGAQRLPNTSNVAFPGIDRQALLMALDQANVACSVGTACSSGAPETSAAHRAMGLSEELQRGAIRFSLGHSTTEAEIEALVSRISLIYKRLRHG